MTPNPPKIPTACMAPPLTESRLAEIRQITGGVHDERLHDAMTMMLQCVEKWWSLPDSRAGDQVVKGVKKKRVEWEFDQGRTRVSEQPLEEQYVDALWNVTPWMDELLALEPLLEKIDPVSQKALRDAAFTLMFFCKELTLDREPMTMDRLQGIQ